MYPILAAPYSGGPGCHLDLPWAASPACAVTGAVQHPRRTRHTLELADPGFLYTTRSGPGPGACGLDRADKATAAVVTAAGSHRRAGWPERGQAAQSCSLA